MRPLVGMGAHGRGSLAREVYSTTPTASTASLPVLCGVVPPDLREIRLFEGLELDSWESGPAHVEGLDLQPDTYGRSAVHW